GASGWLTATLDRSTTPARITLQPTTGSLAQGQTYSATVPVTSASARTGTGTQSVNVQFTVGHQVPALQVSSTTVRFASAVGAGSPAPQVVIAGTDITLPPSDAPLGTISYRGGQPTGWPSATLDRS